MAAVKVFVFIIVTSVYDTTTCKAAVIYAVRQLVTFLFDTGHGCFFGLFSASLVIATFF